MKNYYFYTEQLCVGYHGKPLIENIEITLQKGEILTLVGPNGAGKSTVLKSIVGQLKSLGGTIYLEGDAISRIKQTKLAEKMAVVFTEKLKTELMTCEDVVATGRYPYTGRFGILSKEDYIHVHQAMELVHVSKLRQQDFSKVSDGQKQRVMLARAISQEPDIIILDEPTSYLDIKYKLDFMSALQELRKKKELTVILSLHELDLAEKVSDKILCLNSAGYVERFGTPEEIFQPDYIRHLFGIQRGSFDEVNGTIELQPPEGEAGLFVLAGCGSGRSTYRRLQREGKAFVTGILYQNDLDYPVARALAREVLAAESFEPIPAELMEKAKRRVDACREVLCCRESFGSLETENQALYEYAVKTGKLKRSAR